LDLQDSTRVGCAGSNYCPIANLVSISKILERLVLARITCNIYRVYFVSVGPHGRPTLLKIVNYLNMSMESDSQERSCRLISRPHSNLSTVTTLLLLESDFGICGLTSFRFRSYRSCLAAVDHRVDIGSCDSLGIKYRQYANHTRLDGEPPEPSHLKVLSKCFLASTFWFLYLQRVANELELWSHDC